MRLPERIDPVLKTLLFPQGCRIDQCKGICCKRHGAWIDSEEKNSILLLRDQIKVYMRPEARDPDTWFRDTMRDNDFQSGVAYETSNINGDCVFFHPDHLCAIQRAALSLGFHEWIWKPSFCILFPLTITDGVLTLAVNLGDFWCMGMENRTVPALRAMERELHYLFGRVFLNRNRPVLQTTR